MERRLVVREALHKWVATVATVSAVIWAAMAYYIKAEDTQVGMQLQSQINVLQAHQATSARVHDLVLTIDKKLANIETSLTQQTSLIVEVKDLRKEVNYLKVELAKSGRLND